MKYCVKCGEKIDDNAEFCSFCGQKQPFLPPAAIPIAPIEQPQLKKKQRLKGNVGDTITCVLVIISIIIMGILYFIFQDLANIIISIIILITVLSCVFRLVLGSIGEFLERRKTKKSVAAKKSE